MSAFHYRAESVRWILLFLTHPPSILRHYGIAENRSSCRTREAGEWTHQAERFDSRLAYC